MAWLKTKNASKHIDVSPRTLRQLVSEGYLKPSIIKGKYYFNSDTLDEFMESNVQNIDLDGIVKKTLREFTE